MSTSGRVPGPSSLANHELVGVNITGRAVVSSSQPDCGVAVGERYSGRVPMLSSQPDRKITDGHRGGAPGPSDQGGVGPFPTADSGPRYSAASRVSGSSVAEMLAIERSWTGWHSVQPT